MEDRSLINEFVAESREQLSSVEKDFLELERLAGRADAELINRIFRVVHTIKGSAGFLGLSRLGQVAHAMETLLGRARSGELQLQRPTIDILLQGVDCLTAMLDDVDASNAMDMSAILAQLQTQLEEQTNSPTNAPLPARTPPSAGPLFDLRQYDLTGLDPAGRYYYALAYALHGQDSQAQKAASAVIEQDLARIGTIIDSRLSAPSTHGSAAGETPALYQVLYSTVVEPDLISAAVELPAEKIICLESPLRAGSARPVQAASSAAPATGGETIRISVGLIDKLMTLVGELVLVRNQQLSAVDTAGGVSRPMVQQLDLVTAELQEHVLRARMQPLGTIFSKFTRIVRDIGSTLHKQLELVIRGGEVEIDKTILEGLSGPLTHLIRNSCDHGIELPAERLAAAKPAAGRITLTAAHCAGQIHITLGDDGRGLDIEAIKAKAVERQIKTADQLAAMKEREIFELIFLPGFSTAHQISELSGRGVGMDVVKTSIEKLGGTIEISSRRGQGTTITLSLPLTLAIIPSLIVLSGGLRYAIPQGNVQELIRHYDHEALSCIECAGNQEWYRLRDSLLPVIRLEEILARSEPFTPEVTAEITEQHRRLRCERLERAARSYELTLAVLKSGELRFVLLFDGIRGEEEIVVKPMHPAVQHLSIYAGSTILGDGRIAMILDALGLCRHAGAEAAARQMRNAPEQPPSQPHQDGNITRRELLVFRSGPEERFAVGLEEIIRVEPINTAKIEKIGRREYVTVEGVSTLLLRLEQLLTVSAAVEQPEMLLLLPRVSGRPWAVLVSGLIDSNTYAYTLNTQSHCEDGLIGTALLDGHLALLPDLGRLIRKAEPAWGVQRD